MVEIDESIEDIKKENQKEAIYGNFFQIDVLKALMIFLVIFDHTIPWDIKNNMGVALWERISIPIFMIIMGFNIGHSFQKKKNKNLESYYTEGYFGKKIIRFIVPFIILYIVSTAIGSMIYGPSIDLIEAGQWGTRYDERHLIIGILPFWGPGNWFIPVIFGAIIILPLVYKGFSGSTTKAIIALIACYIIEIIAQLVVFTLKNPNPPPTYQSWDDYYNAILIIYSIFFLFSSVGLGMWFSRNHNIFKKQNAFIWILFPISLVYLINYQFFGYRILVDGVALLTGDYNLLVFPYSAFLFLIVMRVLPNKSNSRLAKIIKSISRATYHILLTQILYFGIVYALYGDHYRASIFGINYSEDYVAFLYLMINWSICIPIGTALWYGEKHIKFYIRRHIEIEQN